MLAQNMRSRLYIFRAERLNLAEGAIGPSNQLDSNAGNLAQVLHTLQTTNTARLQLFNRLVTTVIPDVTQISVPPVSSSNARISVWTIDPALERDDLAIPLSECGTEIGQVLAILYV